MTAGSVVVGRDSVEPAWRKTSRGGGLQTAVVATALCRRKRAAAGWSHYADRAASLQKEGGLESALPWGKVPPTVKEIYTLEDLRSWKRTKPPIRLGVIGQPVAHSLSPQMQNAALKDAGSAMQYARFEIAPDDLKPALELLAQLDFVGLNLTVPHKVAALGLVHEIDEAAREIGAINTIRCDAGKLRGFNTDGQGFPRAIREEFAVDLRDLRVLLLGAGGAARAIAWQCAKENCERLVIANRDAGRAAALVDQLRPYFAGPRVLGPVARLQAIALDEIALRFQIANSDLVVNATPLGLNRNDPLPLPARLIEPHLMIYDTVYASRPTTFVTGALEAGARAANGLSMLLHQGALAFEIWLDRPAPIEAMRNTLRTLTASG